MTRPTILDGGMGQELIRRGAPRSGELWSAWAMLENPELVSGVHADYVAAGCDVLTTNTYATFADRLVEHGLGERAEEPGGAVGVGVGHEVGDPDVGLLENPQDAAGGVEQPRTLVGVRVEHDGRQRERREQLLERERLAADRLQLDVEGGVLCHGR